MSNLEQVVKSLKYGTPEERAEAIKQISDSAYAPAVPHLAVLLLDSDSGTQYLAASALTRIGDEAEKAIPELLKALRTEDMFVRVAVTSALIRIGQPSVPGLIKALFDQNKAVRRASAMALGKIGHPRALPPLQVALNDGDESVRRYSAQAIARIQEATA